MLSVVRCDWAKLNVLQKRWLVCRLAALLILRRDSQTALPKIALSVGKWSHGRVVRVADNLLIRATNLPNTCHFSAIGAGLLRLAKGNDFIYKSSNGDRIC